MKVFFIGSEIETWLIVMNKKILSGMRVDMKDKAQSVN